MQFYASLWKKNPNKEYGTVKKWKKHLNKQRKRLANSRKIKNREKINKLMGQINKKLANSYK